MSGFLKIYTDASHTNELAHITDVSTTINHTGGYSAGATSIVLASTTGMPPVGYIDIIDGTNGNETLQYLSISGTTMNLATATAHTHPTGVTVNEWIYQLPVGDQTLGILNDGTNAVPNGVGVNVATFYVYNAGDQTAQSSTLSTVNSSPSTASGYADTLLSLTSATSGFANSINFGNISAGSAVQFWAVEEVPTGQSNAGNPQVCDINLAFQSV